MLCLNLLNGLLIGRHCARKDTRTPKVKTTSKMIQNYLRLSHWSILVVIIFPKSVAKAARGTLQVQIKIKAGPQVPRLCRLHSPANAGQVIQPTQNISWETSKRSKMCKVTRTKPHSKLIAIEVLWMTRCWDKHHSSCFRSSHPAPHPTSADQSLKKASHES